MFIPSFARAAAISSLVESCVYRNVYAGLRAITYVIFHLPDIWKRRLVVQHIIRKVPDSVVTQYMCKLNMLSRLREARENIYARFERREKIEKSIS